MLRINRSQSSGAAFADQIVQERTARRSNSPFDRKSSHRGYLMALLVLLGACAIILKLSVLQIFQGRYYSNLSDSNRIKTVTIHAPRGTIFDRNNKPLTYNVPGYRQIILNKTNLLSQEEAIPLIARNARNLEIDSLRSYPYKEISAHILGYIGQISPQKLREVGNIDYGLSDLVGLAGVEAAYEGDLRGTNGRQLIEIDSAGLDVRKLGETDPIPGKNITLTVDIDVQKAAFEAMGEVKKGAVIATTPKGEVLALVSKPSFDPNLFTQGRQYKAASESGYLKLEDVLGDSSNQPLLNRAISGLYPPGSTFKIVVASTGLSKKIIDESYTVSDTGIIRVGEFSFANWYYTGYGRTEGDLNVVGGIKRSNDIFFYKLAEKIGVEEISEGAKLFGSGSSLGLDLSGEAEGLVPTPEWKKQEIGEAWYLGDTYHYGIGQGYLLSTPLQVNAWAQIIADGGSLLRPHLNKDLQEFKLRSTFLDKKTIDLVRRGMIESCAPGGVAWPLFELRIKNKELRVDGRNFLKVATGSADLRQVVVACKTGTAEHTPGKEPHAWITLFAPAYDPEIVVTVLAEESGEGSNVAAPIAKKVLEEYFSKK